MDINTVAASPKSDDPIGAAGCLESDGSHSDTPISVPGVRDASMSFEGAPESASSYSSEEDDEDLQDDLLVFTFDAPDGQRIYSKPERFKNPFTGKKGRGKRSSKTVTQNIPTSPKLGCSSCTSGDEGGHEPDHTPYELQCATPMTVDTIEDYWTRLHDIRVNGSVLEYAGRGKNIHDNGLAQCNVPLSPLNHYFEIKIIDPGESCYIAIGLARKDYPVHKHPGWNRGSIAFHADDGKIFIGSGVGTPFGPRCSKNDVLGCGIVFPLSYSDSVQGCKHLHWPWETGQDSVPPKARVRPRRHIRDQHNIDNFQDHSSESEDDVWWNNRNQVYEDKVKVFFMRNSKLLGIKEIRIPKGGFFPTVGMMSKNEQVLVDLHPLTG